jgi:phosphatidylglycerol:prolipoprotein diacylglycerol transferase
VIRIGLDPDLISSAAFTLSWHGLLSFVAVALAVYLVARWAPGEGVSKDAVYSTALWAIVGGVVGARLVHVIDRWDFYGQNLFQVLAIWNGGIALYGAVLGGFVGGYIYAKWAGLPAGKLADLTAPAMLLAMAFGRLGDVINGEHCATLTTLPWGFVYTHPDSPARFCPNYLAAAPALATDPQVPTPASHPAVVYEALWDLAVFGVLWWLLRRRLKPDGMLFVAFLALYSLGRFFISFLRVDKVWLADLNQAQLIALLVVAASAVLLTSRARFVLRPAAQQRGPGRGPGPGRQPSPPS